MSNASAIALPTTLDEDAWEDLLSFIEERRTGLLNGLGTELKPLYEVRCLRERIQDEERRIG